MAHLSHLHWESLAYLDATNPSIKRYQKETKSISKTKFQLRDQHKENYHQSQQSQLYWQRLKIGGKTVDLKRQLPPIPSELAKIENWWKKG